MNLITQFAAALFFSLIIALIAAPGDFETVAAITFSLTALIIYFRHKGNIGSTIKKKGYPFRVKYPPNLYAWPPLMEFDVDVVGESYYQDAIEIIAKQLEAKYDNNPNEELQPLTAYLVPDDNNSYDDKAVRIEIKGMQVGHLSREDARSFRRRLGSKKLTGQITTCGAMIIARRTHQGRQATVLWNSSGHKTI